LTCLTIAHVMSALKNGNASKKRDKKKNISDIIQKEKESEHLG